MHFRQDQRQNRGLLNHGIIAIYKGQDFMPIRYVKELSNTEIARDTTLLEIIIISIFRQNQRQFLQFVEPNLHQY